MYDYHPSYQSSRLSFQYLSTVLIKINSVSVMKPEHMDLEVQAAGGLRKEFSRSRVDYVSFTSAADHRGKLETNLSISVG
jgi:hypothetical protein